MYYYITEQPRSREEQREFESARELLTNLGISGEFVTTSNARTVEELAELGVAKRYSTIVALGRESLINQVGTLLAGTPYVFGAIPIVDHGCLELMSGVKTLHQAAEALKYRRIHMTSIARIEPNKYFLTEVMLKTARPIPITLTIDRAQASLEATSVRISGSGTIVATNELATGSRFQQWLAALSGQRLSLDRYTSRFNATRLVLETDRTYPVYLGSTVLAKTPLALEVLPNTLKMIMKRDSLSPIDQSAAGGPHS
ncbi:hypothetical protein HY524_01220 [Candidatus Berkelbacteria bacterium]|nr:hypothetical protein [Candidatus Berkelbacteria bacterium]